MGGEEGEINRGVRWEVGELSRGEGGDDELCGKGRRKNRDDSNLRGWETWSVMRCPQDSMRNSRTLSV